MPTKNPQLNKSFQNIRLSVNHDIFRYGILKSHQKLSNQNLRRMIQYCLKKQSTTSKTNKDNLDPFSNTVNSSENQGKPFGSINNSNNSFQTLDEDYCYPTLSWQSWRYIAVNKLQITETLAWAYFDCFQALHFPKNPIQRKEITENKIRFLNYDNPLENTIFGGNDKNASNSGNRANSAGSEKSKKSGVNCSSLNKKDGQLNTTKLPDGKHWHNFRSCETVPTLKFVFFLQLQQLAQDPKKSLRRSLSGEIWPEMTGSLSNSFNDKDLRDPKNAEKLRSRSKIENYSSTSNSPSNNNMNQRSNSSLGVYHTTENYDTSSNHNLSQSGINDEHSSITHVRETISDIIRMCIAGL